MKRKFYILILIILCLLCIGCNINKTLQYYTVTIEYNNGDEFSQLSIEQGKNLLLDDEIEKTGYIFGGWYLDEDCTIILPDNYIVNNDITVYAKWELETNKVIFYANDQIFNEQNVIDKDYVQDPGIPERKGYTFTYWSSDKEGSIVFNFNKKVSNDVTLYAQWEPTQFIVKYELGYECYPTKYDLYVDFFGNFYDFLIAFTNVNFANFNITNKDEFLSFCSDWNANNNNSFYGVGNAFGRYFITQDIGGTLEEQPITTFIGYCYQNNMYVDFILFLMDFFAYWRTDEGYTGSSSDPNNLGNDFFASPWASMVDTCKFFYFTSENLNDTYPWFTSERVKNALDNVPGVNADLLDASGTIEDPVILKATTRMGYTFLGWYDENGNSITEVYEEMTVYARWEKEN